MRTTYGYNGGSKTLASATAETTTWSANELPGFPAAAFYVALTGTARDIDSLTRIRLKGGSSTIWDCDENHHQALVQRLSRSNHDPADADTRFEIPLYVPDAKGDDRYSCLFPPGQTATLEIVHDTTGSAGTAVVGWRLVDNPDPLVVKYYPMFLCSIANIAASVTNGRVPLTQSGYLRGFSINTTGLTSMKLVVNGRELIDLSGPLLIQSQMAENRDAFTDPIFIKLDQMELIVPGTSYFQLTTGSTWSGVANEIGVYTYVPL